VAGVYPPATAAIVSIELNACPVHYIFIYFAHVLSKNTFILALKLHDFSDAIQTFAYFHPGNANVTLQNCCIYGNSGAGSASAQLTARMVSVNEIIVVQGGETLNAIKMVGQPPLPDPYASVPLPNFSGATSAWQASAIASGRACDWLFESLRGVECFPARRLKRTRPSLKVTPPLAAPQGMDLAWARAATASKTNACFFR
jgi:hypothetical protein